MPWSLQDTERTERREQLRRARPLLGTLVDIRASGLPNTPLIAAVDAAFAAIEQIHHLMSYHEADSDVSRINRHGAERPIHVHEHTYTVLTAALRFAALSDGAFDPCVGDSLEAWGCLPVPADEHRVDGAYGADWRDVQLFDGQWVRLRRPLRLDLGGIAKGFAVDLATQVLLAAGVESCVVNAGGDLRVSGPCAEVIALRDPLAPAHITHSISLHDEALATSAAYYSRTVTSGGDVSALVDPRDRSPYLGSGSVSVRAPVCMTADALTKVVLFAAPDIAEKSLKMCDAQALLQQPGSGAA